jgi:collagenase-like PrtC family protease
MENTMRLAVGYQMSEQGEPLFAELVARYREHIAEVYFPWGAMPSGRAALTQRRGYVDWGGQRQLEDELLALKNMGVRLDLLFNANCYGGQAVSQYLQHQVMSVLDYLGDLVGLDLITTTSPAIAWMVKQQYPHIEIRASVNMRVGTVAGMQYVSDRFDSFHVQRDVQRHMATVGELTAWAREVGKGLVMLANSGCLAFCSGQTFHDNLVAHETEVDESLRVEGFAPHVCWNYLKDRAHWPVILQSTWIRPEDLHHYEGLFEVVKLATRMHARPELVIEAYVNRRYRGNLLDLFEPGFGPVLAPYALDNEAFPADWFAMTSTCDRQCHRCGYCATVLEQVLVAP